MKYSWSKTVVPIAALFSFRMLGLFLLIPIFTVYAQALNGATPLLIGVALGAYGLSQGLLQMPFGFLSDKYGRKPIIAIGLLLFAAGSLLGALSHSIYVMIIARTLQGTGAIGSVLIALLADLTLEKDRTKGMAVIGLSIGLSFSLSMVMSPIIAHHFGLAGVFYLTTLLALLGLGLLYWIIPTPNIESFHEDSEPNRAFFKIVLRNFNLLRLDAGIFCQHFILTSTFFVMPLILKQHVAQNNVQQSWHFYFFIMILAFLAMIPFILLGEKKNKMKELFVGAVFLTTITQGLLAVTYNQWQLLCVLVFLYFTVFNILEALLPSLISKQAPAHCKGTAMGIYSTAQFLGIFAGGVAAGLLYTHFNTQGIFIANALLGTIWLSCSFFMTLKKQ